MADAEKENIVDIILTQAAKEAAEELGAALAPPAGAPEMPPRARRRILRTIRRTQKRPLPLRIVRTAACFMLAAFVGLGGTVMSVEALRENFISYVFDKDAPSTKFSININSKAPYNGEILSLGFVPDGFECTDSKINYERGSEFLYFKGENNDYFWINMYCSDIEINADTENAELENIEINGYDAVLITKTYMYEGLCHSVIWSDAKHIFDLFGCLSKKTILRIAGNITVPEL